MPLYDFSCENPDCPTETFEDFNKFNEGPLGHCPDCKQLSQKRLISGGMFVSIKGYQTLGSLADKNRKEMGQYNYDKKMKEKEERAIQASTYVGKTFNGGKSRQRQIGDRNYIPPWREGPIDKSLEKLVPKIVEDQPSKIDIKTAEEAHRYIMTGKKGQGSGPPTI